MRDHPCFNETCINEIKRLHLPVAQECNIHCNFCDKKVTCAHVNKPGVTKRVLKSEEIKEYIKNIDKNRCIFGIAGPGEALYNEETFKCLNVLKDYTTCLCTNGLLLNEKIDELVSLNLNFLSVTLNSLNAEVSQKIYSYVIYKNKKYFGADAAELLLEKQLKGLKKAAKRQINLKVNTVYIPGVNDDQILPIAKLCNRLNVDIMNIIPIIPSGKFSDCNVDFKKLNELRKEAANYILQKETCSRCRADAYGYINNGDEKIG